MPEIKSSFIPKKPAPTAAPKAQRGRSVGLVFIGALVIFFSSLVVAGGLYLYRVVLSNQIEGMREDVSIAEREIQPRLVERVTRFDKRLEIADSLLREHVVVTPLFRLLAEKTLPQVRYERFRLSVNDAGGFILSLAGEADDYSVLALQADIFGQSEQINEPIFSNLRLNAAGNVSFQFSGVLTPSLLRFENNLTPAPVEESVTPNE